MKFLRHGYRGFKKTPIWCWNDSGSQNIENEDSHWQDNQLIKNDIERNELDETEKKEKILEIVKRPIEFSLRDIKFIEQNQELIKHDKNFRHYFRKISEYYLSLAVAKSNIIPPSVLYAIGSSKLARDFLPISLKRNIDLITDEHLKKVLDLADNPVENWTNAQTSEILGLYKRLKVKKKSHHKKINEVFRKISQKIVKKAIDIAQNPEKLNTSQRLILWEVRRQIPEAFQAGQEVASLLEEASQTSSSALLKDILEGKQKNAPDLIILWGLLEDLAYQNDVAVDENDRKKLRSFILRSNASQLLDTVNKSNPKILLPIHLEALKQLDSPNFKNLWNATDKDFSEKEIDISEEGENNKRKQDEYAAKIRKLNKEIKTIKDAKFQDLINSGKVSAADKKEYGKAKDDLDRFLKDEKFGEDTIFELAQQLKEAFINKNRESLQRKFEDSLSDLTNPEKSGEDKVSALEKIISRLETLKKDGWNTTLEEEKEKKEQKTAQDKAQKTREEIREALQEGNQIPASLEAPSRDTTIKILEPEETQKLSKILDTLKNENILKKAQTKDQALKDLRENIQTELNQEESNAVKILEKKLQDLRTEETEKKIKKDQEDEILEIYDNPESVRESIYKGYEEGLNSRIQNHTLFAADFQVLMDDEVHPTEDFQVKDFRNKFKKVLDQASINLSDIESALNKIDLDEDEPNLDHLSTYLEQIEGQIGLSFFREALEPELKKFDTPQIKDEIIKGAMGYYHDAIEDKIKTAINMLPEDQAAFWNQKNIFLNQVRSHSPVNTSTEIRQLENAYTNYFAQKQGLDTKTETERNLIEGAIEGLSEEEKEKIRRAFGIGVNFLQKGYLTKDFQFPGTQKLNEASIQSKTFTIDLAQFTKNYNEKIEQLITEISVEDPDPRNIKIAFDDFHKSWENEGKENLEAKIKSFRNLCEEVIFNEQDENGKRIYQTFLNTYFGQVDEVLTHLKDNIDELAKIINSGSNITKKEPIFESIKTNFLELGSWTSFDGGKLTGHKLNIENRLFDHQLKDEKGKNIKDQKGNNIDEDGFAETVQHLKSYGVFDDHEKAQEEFQKTQDTFRQNAKSFEDTTYKVKIRIQLDIKKLNDEKFQQKYGMYKDEAQTTIDNLDKSGVEFDQLWEKFDNPKYFQEWWERYQKNDESRFDAIREFQDIQRLKSVAEEMNQKVKDFDKWLEDWTEYGEIERKNKWYNRVSTEPFSLYSIYILIKTNMDIVEIRSKRKQDKMAYGVGMQIYGDSAWGKEFRRMSEESESERVKQWETNYASLSYWETAEILYDTNDPDEAKACITLLNNKGYLKWDNPRLWRTLMRLQSTVSFNIPEDMNLEIQDIVTKVGTACEIIWSKEDFIGWDTDMDESMKKAKGSYEKEFRDLTDSQDAQGNSMLALELSNMLEKWSQGDTADVHPAKFFSFLHLAFEQGKLNTQPDKRWYYLIKGVTTKNPQGEALLPKTVFHKFYNELMANMPYFEFFADGSSWKKDGKIVPPNTPGAEKRIWRYSDYEAWDKTLSDGGGKFFPTQTVLDDIEHFFYDVVDMSDEARSRVLRTGRKTNENADHDDGETFFTGLSYRNVMQMLSSRSEGTQQVTDDFWRAYLAGFNRFMTNKKRFIEHYDIEYGKDDPHWQKMRKGILYDVGEKLRIATGVIQVLSGNMKSHAQKPLIFNEVDWNKTKGLTLKKAQESKDEIHSMVFQLLDNQGDEKNYKKNLQKNLYNQSSIADTLMGTPEFKETNRINDEFFGDEEGGKYFKNTDAIWSVLKDY